MRIRVQPEVVLQVRILVHQSQRENYKGNIRIVEETTVLVTRMKRDRDYISRFHDEDTEGNKTKGRETSSTNMNKGHPRHEIRWISFSKVLNSVM